MRLLFLSSTRGNNNRDIKSLVADWYRKGKIGYIPSSPDPFGVSFQQAKDWFQKQDSQGELRYLDIFDKSVKWWGDRLNEFSGFFINGGNTFTLLMGLHNSEMGESLIRVAKETNKPILGVDEGGIALTPEVSFSTSHDDVGLHNKQGLHVVDFAFCPHYKDSDSRGVEKYMNRSHTPDVYGVSEVSGLAVEGKKVTPLGVVRHFSLTSNEPERFTPAEARG